MSRFLIEWNLKCFPCENFHGMKRVCTDFNGRFFYNELK